MYLHNISSDFLVKIQNGIRPALAGVAQVGVEADRIR